MSTSFVTMVSLTSRLARHPNRRPLSSRLATSGSSSWECGPSAKTPLSASRSCSHSAGGSAALMWHFTSTLLPTGADAGLSSRTGAGKPVGKVLVVQWDFGMGSYYPLTQCLTVDVELLLCSTCSCGHRGGAGQLLQSHGAG